MYHLPRPRQTPLSQWGRATRNSNSYAVNYAAASLVLRLFSFGASLGLLGALRITPKIFRGVCLVILFWYLDGISDVGLVHSSQKKGGCCGINSNLSRHARRRAAARPAWPISRSRMHFIRRNKHSGFGYLQPFFRHFSPCCHVCNV